MKLPSEISQKFTIDIHPKSYGHTWIHLPNVIGFNTESPIHFYGFTQPPPYQTQTSETTTQKS